MVDFANIRPDAHILIHAKVISSPRDGDYLRIRIANTTDVSITDPEQVARVIDQPLKPGDRIRWTVEGGYRTGRFVDYLRNTTLRSVVESTEGNETIVDTRTVTLENPEDPQA